MKDYSKTYIKRHTSAGECNYIFQWFLDHWDKPDKRSYFLRYNLSSQKIRIAKKSEEWCATEYPVFNQDFWEIEEECLRSYSEEEKTLGPQTDKHKRELKQRIIEEYKDIYIDDTGVEVCCYCCKRIEKPFYEKTYTDIEGKKWMCPECYQQQVSYVSDWNGTLVEISDCLKPKRDTGLELAELDVCFPDYEKQTWRTFTLNEKDCSYIKIKRKELSLRCREMAEEETSKFIGDVRKKINIPDWVLENYRVDISYWLYMCFLKKMNNELKGKEE